MINHAKEVVNGHLRLLRVLLLLNMSLRVVNRLVVLMQLLRIVVLLPLLLRLNSLVRLGKVSLLVFIRENVLVLVMNWLTHLMDKALLYMCPSVNIRGNLDYTMLLSHFIILRGPLFFIF